MKCNERSKDLGLKKGGTGGAECGWGRENELEESGCVAGDI